MINSSYYQPRDYRSYMNSDDLAYFTVIKDETDLRIAVDRTRFSKELAEDAIRLVEELRLVLLNCISHESAFLHSLTPLQLVGEHEEIINTMLKASFCADVGPMAAVAGAVAQCVGKRLAEKYSLNNIIVENGGDLYIKTDKKRTVAVSAGESLLSNKLGLLIEPDSLSWGVCTSSGTVGHSLSFGSADAAVVVARSATVADAFATALCNRVNNINDIEAALAWLMEHEHVTGGLVIINERFGAIGDIQIVPLT